jgi:hypothetical protein
VIRYQFPLLFGIVLFWLVGAAEAAAKVYGFEAMIAPEALNCRPTYVPAANERVLGGS